MSQERETVFSEPDRIHRYVLWREWDRNNHKFLLFIGLNPSTADEKRNDPTIRRCISFAKNEGCGALCVVNIFAFRATKSSDLRKHDASKLTDPQNDDWLSMFAKDAEKVVAAWGTKGGYLGRDRQVMNKLGKLCCLGKTKRGHPRHPLFVKGGTELEPFNF